MTDDDQSVRRGEWGECCQCVHLFRTFRLAANLSNLVLILLALLLTEATGRLFDFVAPSPATSAQLAEPARALEALADSTFGPYARISGDLQYYAGRAVGAALHGRLLGDRPDGVLPLPRATAAPLEDDGLGVLDCLEGMANTGIWFVTENRTYAALFLLLTLAIWALLGGAACRIMAIQAARDERISIRDALAFSWEKLVGFISAPLIPLGLIVVTGLFLAGGGLVGAIPYLGELFTGLFFFLALLGGLIIALCVIGAVAGGPLMWPTIAVEGSDAFDAISRSYSYVFARPWKAAFYAAVSFVYGSVCYLFVRVVVWLLLIATHMWVGLGMFPERTVETHADRKLAVMWERPTFGTLAPEWPTFPPPVDASATVEPTTPRPGSRAEPLGAYLIWLWVSGVVGLLYALVFSFFFSSATMIYLLLRQDVDATDMEDVFVDEEEQDETFTPAPEPPPADAETATSPSDEPTKENGADSDEKSDDDEKSGGES